MKRRQRGVTLMELLTVVVIIGILTAIAYPSYREQVRRSNRTEARVALEQTYNPTPLMAEYYAQRASAGRRRRPLRG